MTPAIPKGPNRRMRQRVQEQADRLARQRCRETVMEREQYRCRICHAYLGEVGHTHEVVFRSLGGDPMDAAGAIYVCAEDHTALHAHTKTLWWDGPVLMLTEPGKAPRAV
jgi:hypothetical protein